MKFSLTICIKIAFFEKFASYHHRIFVNFCVLDSLGEAFLY